MTLPNTVIISQALSHLKHIAPTGYAVGLHIRFTTPRIMFVTYPEVWLTLYGREGLLMKDPTVRWGMSRPGVLDWSQIDEAMDPDGVMSRAADHGLRYGFSCARQDPVPSLAGFARSDRPFTESEISEAVELFERLHELTREESAFDSAELAELQAHAEALRTR